jgi:hypothetical protein
MSEEKYYPAQRDVSRAKSQYDEHRVEANEQPALKKAESNGSTQELSRDGATPPPGTMIPPPYLITGVVDAYYSLPFAPERHHPGQVRWRIELHGLAGGKPIGLDILGDVTLGRGSDPSRGPDFDLTPYGGIQCGVSRQHAILKPTPHSLYLLDLQSKNGTQYNGMPMLKGMARSLLNNDIITLGTLRFQVKIIDSPPMRRARGS